MQAEVGINNLELAVAYYTFNIPSMQEKKLVTRSLAPGIEMASLTLTKVGYLFSHRI